MCVFKISESGDCSFVWRYANCTLSVHSKWTKLWPFKVACLWIKCPQPTIKPSSKSWSNPWRPYAVHQPACSTQQRSNHHHSWGTTKWWREQRADRTSSPRLAAFISMDTASDGVGEWNYYFEDHHLLQKGMLNSMFGEKHNWSCFHYVIKMVMHYWYISVGFVLSTLGNCWIPRILTRTRTVLQMQKSMNG